MFVSSWIALMSTSKSRKTNNKVRGRVRLSLKRWRILGWTDTTITDLEGILWDNLDLRLFMWLTLCFKNQCIKSWRRSRTSHTLNGQTKWEEIPWGTTRASIANTTKSRGIPSRTAKLYGTIWSNSLERVGYNSFYISLMDRRPIKVRGLGERFFKAPIRHN